MRRYLPLLALVACEKDGNESPSEPQKSCSVGIDTAIDQYGDPIPAGSSLLFEAGSQGGFHTQIGGLMHMQESIVSLSILITGAEGDLIASSGDVPSYYALADYDTETCGGWITTRTLLGGQFELDQESACAYHGLDANLEITAGPIEAGEPITLMVPIVVSVPGC